MPGGDAVGGAACAGHRHRKIRFKPQNVRSDRSNVDDRSIAGFIRRAMKRCIASLFLDTKKSRRGRRSTRARNLSGLSSVLYFAKALRSTVHARLTQPYSTDSASLGHRRIRISTRATNTPLGWRRNIGVRELLPHDFRIIIFPCILELRGGLIPGRLATGSGG